ncbi:TetR family transcriptional regulator [Marinomonas ostreistagni]|uniref:TetR family transcriptional regulator n=1 Tax=Marinomonas ostreistagni TaxID=359209 RepID=UPI001950A83A|nr:TetR/AcrR family transcriptional regulator [Marinomonas ostreistagni]
MNRRAQQKTATRAKIKQVAQRAFFEHGIEPTTTREISRLAGVAVGTFFVHFADKLELVREIYFDAMDGALKSTVGLHSPTPSPTEYIQQVAKTLFPFYGQYGEFTRQIMLDSVIQGGFHHQQTASMKEGVVNRFMEVGVDQKTANIFAENILANYWLVFMECLPENRFADAQVLARLETLNLPFTVSFNNALAAR